MHYTKAMENPEKTPGETPDPESAPHEGDSPEGSTAPADNSLRDWIDRAKRAQELVDAVDLDKIVAHDETEVKKLTTVGNALDDLSEGRDVAHVEGVDTVLPELDPEQQRKSELFAVIANGGFAERLGRLLFIEKGETQLKPLELIAHHEGLPDFDICVAPEASSQSGNFGLFVSPQGIFAASISEPSSTHHWRVVRSSPYDNPEELLQSLRSFSASAFE